MITEPTEHALTEPKVTVPTEPDQASDAEVRKAALRWINSIRTEYGLAALDELPKGIPGIGNGCALAVATEGLSDGTRKHYICGRLVMDWETGKPLAPGLNFAREGKTVHYPVPPLVKEFMRRFDAGQFPDLTQ